VTLKGGEVVDFSVVEGEELDGLVVAACEELGGVCGREGEGVDSCRGGGMEGGDRGFEGI